MSRGELFLETLKRIGYHEVDALDSSDFDWMFREKELSPLLEVFCTLTEDNVLTDKDIEEYSTLSASELEEIEIMENSGQLVTNGVNNEKKRETFFLQEQLSQIESHNKSLEKQVKLFKKHEENLLEEQEACLKLQLDTKKKFQAYEMHTIHTSESGFVSSLRSILKAVEDVESIIGRPDANNSRIPSSNHFKDTVKQYLEVETEVLQGIREFLHNHFPVQEKENGLSFIAEENFQNKELLKEACFLEKTLKKKMIEKIICEKEVQKIQNMIKYVETVHISPELRCHTSQLRPKLDDAIKLNHKLKKKGDELEACVSDAITKHVDARIVEVIMCTDVETKRRFDYGVEKMLLPMDTLLRQRARLELLINSLQEHQGELQNLKHLLDKALNKIKEEYSCLQERKVQIENEKIEATFKENELDPETSIFLSLYKILAMSNEPGIQDLPSISLEDVLQKAGKFFEVEENFTRKQEEKLKTVELIERYASSMEKLLTCEEKDYSNWHELEQALNADLNSLDMKLTLFVGSLSECIQELNQKQKLLERNGNLRLARNLYVHALMNKELFKKCIQDIERTIENSADFNPRS